MIDSKDLIQKIVQDLEFEMITDIDKDLNNLIKKIMILKTKAIVDLNFDLELNTNLLLANFKIVLCFIKDRILKVG